MEQEIPNETQQLQWKWTIRDGFPKNLPVLKAAKYKQQSEGKQKPSSTSSSITEPLDECNCIHNNKT